MNRFKECLQFTLAREGGFDNDPDDPGGITNKGITIGVYSEYCGLPITKKLVSQLRDISDDQLQDIYLTRYWNLVKAGQYPVGVDLCAFDFGVNSGPGTSVRQLQLVVGTKADGFVGPKTLEAIKQFTGTTLAGTLKLCNNFLDARWAYVQTRPAFWKYATGWRNRIELVRTEVTKLLKTETGV